MSQLRIFPAILLVAAALLLAAGVSCQSVLLNYHGIEVPEKNRVLFKSDRMEPGVWAVEHLTVQYHYYRKGPRFDITGKIDFADALIRFGTMDHFDIWIHFVDSENRIIATHNLFVFLTFYEIRTTRFERRFELPPEARGFVFSYSGRAVDNSDSDEGGGASWDFWRRPQD